MIKSLIIFCLSVLILQSAFSQNPYHDSRTLRENRWIQDGGGVAEVVLDRTSAPTAFSVLYKYLSEEDKLKVDNLSDPAEQLQVYENAFQDNPFLSFSGIVLENPLKGLREKGQSLIGAAGNANISSIADGLAKFLVKRTKQELTTAFFEKFYKELKEQKDFQALFPSTFTTLSTLGDDIYNYELYLSSLRNSFQLDMENIFGNGYDWTMKTEGELVKALQTNKKAYVGIKTALFAGRELERGEHPGSVLHSLVKMHKVNAAFHESKIDLSVLHPNVHPIAKTVDLLSQSLRSTSTAHYWITESEFAFFEDPVFLRSYFGMLYQQIKLDPIVFSDNTELIKLLATMADNVNRLKLESLVASVKTHLVTIEESIDVLKNGESRRAGDYFKLTQSLSDAVVSLSDHPVFSQHAKLDLPDNFVFYQQHLSSLWSYIETESYPSAIFETYTLLDSAIGSANRKPALRSFLKYGTFIATVASAESSEEVEAALEAVALPAGSSSIKRKSRSNVALNAYVGLSGGYEWRSGQFGEGGGTFGVSAPIGVAFSKGWYGGQAGNFEERGCGTFFLSLIDLGAVTAYRFDDAASALPELTLKNIFAPGAYFVYGWPNSPVSTGMGIQLGPQLRKISADGAELADNNDVQYSLKLFVAVDIPLLNFRTRPR